jgi:hypothetical protein
MKLPNLIGHYITHRSANVDMSFYSFFKMHYLENQLKDKDYYDDMKLPFKTHDGLTSFITLNIPPEKVSLNIPNQIIYADYSTNFSYSEKFYPLIFHQIWEPPKI